MFLYLKSLRAFENMKKKIKIKFIDFETLINSFYRFFLKKSINKNVNNSKSKHSFLNFNNNLTKKLKKTFRDFYNDFDESLFFDNENNALSTISHV